METSKLYAWATNTRVLNEQRATRCSVEGAFLHSEGTVTFELSHARAPFCLLHARHPDAYRYVPRVRVDDLLSQAGSARDRWTTQLIIHRGQPPADLWSQYQGLLRHLAGEVSRVLADLGQALPVVRAADPTSPVAGEYADLVDEITALLRDVDDALPPSPAG
jgi:hypothetical protein